MTTEMRLFPNMYRDSVSLMKLSAEIAQGPGVEEASFVMATETNIALVVEAGILDTAPAPSPNDLLGVVQGASAADIDAAFITAEAALAQAPSGAGGDVTAIVPRSLQGALAENKDANLVLISCPGEHAGNEAMKALKLGLNVMMFSDNVPVGDEIALKTEAAARGLLVMGPDCGTAIIDGVPLGFANVVRRGPIGVIGASGTGTQEVTCQIDRLGSGISQAIGTGGRDLAESVGGRTMLAALEVLANDPETKVITLISKPPAPAIAEKILSKAAAAGKPVVVNFLGWEGDKRAGDNIIFAKSLEETAHTAVAATGKNVGGFPIYTAPAALPSGDSGPCLRGLYSGGTFCYEAQLELGKVLREVWSTSPADKKFTLNDPWQSIGHTVIDLGDDFFTRGRPHPMIDHSLRNERLVSEAKDPATAVILFDLVLGHGADPDPAGAMAAALGEARKIADDAGRHLEFVASVCGTKADPQNIGRQEKTLRAAGVHLAPSNIRAVHLAMDKLALAAKETAA